MEMYFCAQNASGEDSLRAALSATAHGNQSLRFRAFEACTSWPVPPSRIVVSSQRSSRTVSNASSMGLYW